MVLFDVVGCVVARNSVAGGVRGLMNSANYRATPPAIPDTGLYRNAVGGP
jgi:hypothetical protein